MQQCVTHILTADSSERFEASIRIRSDGLTFSGWSLTEERGFFTVDFPFASDLPTEQAIKNIFFENALLTYHYKTLYVVSDTKKYSLVPECVFSEKDRDTALRFCHNIDIRKTQTLWYHVENLSSVLLYAIDIETHEFLVRSLVNPMFTHYLVPMLNLWYKNSLHRHPKQLYALLKNKTFDLVCFREGELLFLNSFEYENINDIVYLIMYTSKQTGFNQLEDKLFFYGDKATCNSLASVTGLYIKEIDYETPQLISYTTVADAEVAVDTVILAECGL